MKAKSGKFAVSLILLLTIVLALYSGIAALTGPSVLVAGQTYGSKSKGTGTKSGESSSSSTTVVTGSNTCPPTVAYVACVTQSTTTVSGTNLCPPYSTAVVCVPQTCKQGEYLLGGQCLPTTPSPCSTPNSIPTSYLAASPGCTPCPTNTDATYFANYPPACRPSKPCLPGSVSTPDSPATTCTPCPQDTKPTSVDLKATAGCDGNVPPCQPGSTITTQVTTKNADGVTVVVTVTATCPPPNGPNSPCGTTDIPTFSANGVINCVPCPKGQSPGITVEGVPACVPHDPCPSGDFAVGADGCTPCPQGTAPASMDYYGDGGCEPNTPPDPCSYGATLTTMTTTTDAAGVTHLVQTTSTCSSTTVVTSPNSCPPTVPGAACVTQRTTIVQGPNSCPPTTAGVNCVVLGSSNCPEIENTTIGVACFTPSNPNPLGGVGGAPTWVYLLLGLVVAAALILFAFFRRRGTWGPGSGGGAGKALNPQPLPPG